MATSQNGFPALTADSTRLYTWTIPGGPEGATRLRLRNGSAGFLLCHLAMWFDARVDDLQDNYQGGALDDWGYAYRPVRGYETTLSNHSSGTAMDLNATEHPLGREDTFTPEEEALIQKRLRLYDGAIRWGGNYRGRKDEMHFEIDADLPTCERVAIELMSTPRGIRILAVNPGQREVILS